MLPSYRIQAVPLLKSHLQKCIRRSRENLAVRTARHLLLTDPEALLRRLPVIMVEDAVLNIQLPGKLLLFFWGGGNISFSSPSFSLTPTASLGLVHVCRVQRIPVGY